MKGRGPLFALGLVAVVFVGLAAAVLLGTAPWEANDENYHATNVETIRSGHMYRITHQSGLESHQPPLYYLTLAGIARLIGLPHNDAQPVPKLVAVDWVANPRSQWRHDVARDSVDEGYVRRLRLLSVVFGLTTVLLAAASASVVSRDRWTPVVAAATCAFVPKFVFLSGVVNNDNMANTLAALATFLAVVVAVRATTRRSLWWLTVALGATTAALLLTKYSGVFLLPGIAAALILAARTRDRWQHELVVMVGAFAGVVFVIAGWWFWLTTGWYGDPLATSAAVDHFRDVAPYLVAGAGSLHRIFVDLPKDVWRTFWYTSGWNQFRWGAWAYLPFWALLTLGLVGLHRPPKYDRRPRSRSGMLVLGILAACSLIGLFVLAIDQNGTQGRLAFVGLPALAVLFAVGMERWRWPTIARFALPMIGIVGTVLALRSDVFAIYG